MSDQQFKNTLPTRAELYRLTPYENSKRVVQAWREAKEELHRRHPGHRFNRSDASELLGGAAPSAYLTARMHVEAVEVYKISPLLAKEEAIRRMRLLNPAVSRISRELDKTQDVRDDVEVLADAVSSVLIRAGDELSKLDAGALAAFLHRDPGKRGATRSALIDLQRWLAVLGRALDDSLRK